MADVHSSVYDASAQLVALAEKLESHATVLRNMATGLYTPPAKPFPTAQAQGIPQPQVQVLEAK